MKNNDDVFQFIQTIVVNRFGVGEEEIDDALTFQELGADSLDIVELVMEIEHEFDIHFSDEKLAELETIEEAVTYVNELKQ